MGNYRKRSAGAVVEAEQISESTEPEQFIGIVYNPSTRTACVPTPDGDVCANIGDWIVQTGLWHFEVLSDGAFSNAYEPLDRQR